MPRLEIYLDKQTREAYDALDKYQRMKVGDKVRSAVRRFVRVEAESGAGANSPRSGRMASERALSDGGAAAE